jgi:hypothetical protein
MNSIFFILGKQDKKNLIKVKKDSKDIKKRKTCILTASDTSEVRLF